MKLLKVIFEITHQFLNSTSLNQEEIEETKKAYVNKTLTKELIKQDLIKIKLDKKRPSEPDRPIDTYLAECYIQTTEEHDEMIKAFKRLEGAIVGLTSANTQETLLQQLDKLKETLK